MKQLVIILLFFTCIKVHSQNHVFVLVDVSKSVSQRQLTDAKLALNEVLTGTPLSKAFVAQGNPQDLANFKMISGDRLSIVRFGSLSTTLAINPNPAPVTNPASDINKIINSVSWTPTDNQTYITLAKAKIAEYAKRQQLTQYKLYVISDNIQDDYGPGGMPNYPDDYTRNLAESYNTSTNPVNEAGYTRLKFNANSLFTLSFSPNVDVSNYSLPGANVNQPQPDVTAAPAIVLTSFANGKKDKPKPTQSNTITLSWQCNCPQGTTFNVALTEVDGKYKDLTKRNLMANTVQFSELPSGKFKIVVSSPNASSALTFIETPSSGMGWVIFLLLLLAAIGTGYYLWNKKRQEKINRFASNNPDDIFSKSNTGGSTTSSNSEYF